MKTADFLIELGDILQRGEPCKENDNLCDYDEWDSLSKMALMAFFEKNFGLKVKLKDLNDVKTVSDLINFAGENIK